LRIIQQLRDAGFVAYFAGGCVRDALLGRVPKDYDVATDATPDAVRRLFGKRRTIAFGASFGVIGVLPPRVRLGQEKVGLSSSVTAADSGQVVSESGQVVSESGQVVSESGCGVEQTEGQARVNVEPTEVATFRSDGEYSDGRRPDSVHYGDARNDALRRDFTINGLFYDPHQGKVIDYVGGLDDLAAGVLRTIGDPVQRFGEDRLRMLRAIRFSATLEFQMHAETLTAIQSHADDIGGVSGERIGAEMRRVLAAPQAIDGLRQMLISGLYREVLPELAGVDMDRLECLLKHAEPRSFSLSLACLGVVISDSGVTLSELGLPQISKRWRLSSAELRQAQAATQHWKTVLNANGIPWSKVQPALLLRDVQFVLGLAEAIAATDGLDRAGCELARDALTWPVEQLDPEPLLRGSDLQTLGFRPGPEFGKMLARLRTRQLDGEITTRDQAIDSLRARES